MGEGLAGVDSKFVVYVCVSLAHVAKTNQFNCNIKLNVLLIVNESDYILGDQNGLFSATCHFPIFSDVPKKYSNIIRYIKNIFKYYSIYQKYSDTVYPTELPLLGISSFPP